MYLFIADEESGEGKRIGEKQKEKGKIFLPLLLNL